jgi:hypothetical protein
MTQAPAQALPLFEGHQVQQARVKITNAGDGLSEALQIAPEAHELGDELAFVIRGHVTQVGHLQKADDEPTIRVHTVKASEATRIDPGVADKMILANREELERLKAEQAGQLALGAEQAAEAREAND